MAFDPTPWFIGGGAQHSPEVARLIAYLAAQGSEGVIGSGDLKVAPLTTPGSSVRVLPGAASILARHSGSAYQSYAARMPTETVVPISATDAAGGRSDLIVARIEDPFAPGTVYTAPADPTTAQYVHVRVIPGVAAGSRTMPAGESGIVLARIDLPANTGTVEAGHITDLRSIPNPQRQRVLRTTPGDPQDGSYDTLTTAYPSYQNWPASASHSIAIPRWATKAYVRGNLGSVALATSNVTGRLRVNFGGLVSPDTGYDLNWTGSTSRHDFLIAAEFAIPANLRGTTQNLRFQGNRSGGSGALVYDYVTISTLDIEFVESVV